MEAFRQSGGRTPSERPKGRSFIVPSMTVPGTRSSISLEMRMKSLG